MLVINNDFELMSVETKVVGKTYRPYLRALEIQHTQALNKDYINELAISNNQKILHQAPSYLAALSTRPIFPSANKRLLVEDSKTLIKLIFKLDTSIKKVEHYFVLYGYCKSTIDIKKMPKNSEFIPTYSFEHTTGSDGVTHFSNRIDYVTFPKSMGKGTDFVISRPSDVLTGISTLKVMDSDVFSYSQYNPFIQRKRVLVNRENINPIAYLSRLFTLSHYPICHSTTLHDKASIYAGVLNEEEPFCHPDNFPFDLTGLNNPGYDAFISLSDIIKAYPHFFKVLTVVKEPVIDYTFSTEDFGKTLLSESLSQEIVLTALEAMSKVGLENIHLKGSNIKNDAEDIVSFSLLRGVSEHTKFNDTPNQIKQVCLQLKTQIFTKLMGLVSKDKIEIAFDLYVTTFGISTLNVQFPTEVGIRRKIYSYAYPTYKPADWSPLMTTIQEAGPLAQRVYEQLRLLNIYI